MVEVPGVVARIAVALEDGRGDPCEISVPADGEVTAGYPAPGVSVRIEGGTSVDVSVMVSCERIVTKGLPVAVSVGWFPVAVRVGVRVGNRVRVGPLVGDL